MTSFLRVYVMTFILLFSISSAEAQDFDFNPQPYVGGGLGGFNVDAGVSSDTVFGGFGLLGVNFNEYIGFEGRVGATADGSSTVNRVQTDFGVDWFVSYLAKLQLPVSEELVIYGLLGGTTIGTRFQPLGGLEQTNSGTNFSFGVGLEYRIQGQLYVGGEWVQYASDADVNAPAFPGLDVWGASATIRYEF